MPERPCADAELTRRMPSLHWYMFCADTIDASTQRCLLLVADGLRCHRAMLARCNTHPGLPNSSHDMIPLQLQPHAPPQLVLLRLSPGPGNMRQTEAFCTPSVNTVASVAQKPCTKLSRMRCGGGGGEQERVAQAMRDYASDEQRVPNLHLGCQLPMPC